MIVKKTVAKAYYRELGWYGTVGFDIDNKVAHGDFETLSLVWLLAFSGSRCHLSLGCKNQSSSVFRPLACGRHFHQLGHEFAEHGHEVVLRSHDFLDVLVSHRHFVQSGGNEGDAA